MTTRRRSEPPDPRRLAPEELRWTCDPEQFPFKTTDEMDECPIRIIGQDRAQEALRLGLTLGSEGYNIFVTGEVGSGRSTVVRRTLSELGGTGATPPDVVFVRNFEDPDQPRRFLLPAGQGRRLREAMDELVTSLSRELPAVYESEEYRRRRGTLVEEATRDQKGRIKEFEKRVQEQGFALMQVQIGPVTRPQLVPVVAGNPVDLDQLENLVEQGRFERDEYEKLLERRRELAAELEGLGKTFRDADRGLRRRIADLDREFARGPVAEAVTELRREFGVDGMAEHLDQLVEDLLNHLASFREGQEPGAPGTEVAVEAPPVERDRYRVNVLVDNSATKGSPVIWETSPSYRNLFGTIDKVRTESGEWQTDHLHVKAGSLLRANGGILVLDALDVLVEPGVWAALKRTLRTRHVEIQSFDPFHMFTGVSLKPEAVPNDVKVVMIGTRYIYRLLHTHDEDFRKIFKVKAEFSMFTDRSDGEIENYSCFVLKKVRDDQLPPFHREAVAAVVEHGVRLAGDKEKLTTRFAEIADLVREAGYWAGRAKARAVRQEHVEQALEQQVYRVSLLEDVLRERIAQGTVLIDLDGEAVGQVNGLAVLDLGDHVFAQPSRITATTAVGRRGVIDIDREARLSGAIHTKGVLILTGFVRERFARDRPLALTATLCFEQNYGGVDGDSASTAELLALLSSLSGVPLVQSIAITGSVNQKGEIQPIGGVNRKIEGFFDLCRAMGLTGRQGVAIPRRNVRHLMLRKDVVDHVRRGKFHVWAVSTVEEALEVMTGRHPGVPDADGVYPEGSTYALADARLRTLAEQVREFDHRPHGIDG